MTIWTIYDARTHEAVAQVELPGDTGEKWAVSVAAVREVIVPGKSYALPGSRADRT